MRTGFRVGWEGFWVWEWGFWGVVLGFGVGQGGFADWCGGCLGSLGYVYACGVRFRDLRGCLGAWEGLRGPVLGLVGKGLGLGFGSKDTGRQQTNVTERHGTGRNSTTRDQHGAARDGKKRNATTNGKERLHTRPGHEHTSLRPRATPDPD